MAGRCFPSASSHGSIFTKSLLRAIHFTITLSETCWNSIELVRPQCSGGNGHKVTPKMRHTQGMYQPTLLQS